MTAWHFFLILDLVEYLFFSFFGESLSLGDDFQCALFHGLLVNNCQNLPVVSLSQKVFDEKSFCDNFLVFIPNSSFEYFTDF